MQAGWPFSVPRVQPSQAVSAALALKSKSVISVQKKRKRNRCFFMMGTSYYDILLCLQYYDKRFTGRWQEKNSKNCKLSVNDKKRHRNSVALLVAGKIRWPAQPCWKGTESKVYLFKKKSK
jgi:hypothetical protein